MFRLPRKDDATIPPPSPLKTTLLAGQQLSDYSPPRREPPRKSRSVQIRHVLTGDS